MKGSFRRLATWSLLGSVCVLCVLISLHEASAGSDGTTRAPGPAIHVSHGKHSDYYHILLTLRPDMFDLSVSEEHRPPPYKERNVYEFAEGGQFEIFIHKEQFPVPTPKCKKYVILRMPATDPSSVGAASKIPQKKALFDRIKLLKESSRGELEVAIELNPYVRVVSRQPLQVELTECNAFFRHASGAYVDHTGPLKR